MLSPGGSVYFTCIQNMNVVTNKFKSGGLNEKHVVATWNLGNHFSICLQTQGNQEKPVSRWPVAGPSEYWLLASSPASKVKKQQYTQYSKYTAHCMMKLFDRFAAAWCHLQNDIIWIVFTKFYIKINLVFSKGN